MHQAIIISLDAIYKVPFVASLCCAYNFVSYDVIKLNTIENNRIFNKFIFHYLNIISEHNLAKVALI